MIESKNVDKAGTTFGNILTDRLIIRLANPDDAEEIYAYRSDTIENQYQGWFPESAKEVRNYITNMPMTIDIADVCFQFAILTKNENRLIGDMGIIFTGHERMQVEIGCTLNKAFQGKGYAIRSIDGNGKLFFHNPKETSYCSIYRSKKHRLYPTYRTIGIQERSSFQRELFPSWRMGR